MKQMINRMNVPFGNCIHMITSIYCQTRKISTIIRNFNPFPLFSKQQQKPPRPLAAAFYKTISKVK